MQDMKQVFSTTINGHSFTVEIGELAKQANGACMVKYGDTSVLATVTASKQPKDLPFFPLTVNYEERLYAVGKIPGGFIKRVGRASEKAMLTSRLIDRPIRPLFPEGFRNEVQVISTVLSVDQDCSPEMAAMIGSSIALSISDIPFDGPIAGAQVGQIDGEVVINPSIEQQESSNLDLTVAGTKDAINMVEANSDEVTEEVMIEAIMFAHEEIARLTAFQEEIIEAISVEKMNIEVFQIDETIQADVKAQAKAKLMDAIKEIEKHDREVAIDKVKDDVHARYEEDEEAIPHVKETLDKIVKEEVRRLITEDKKRPDGRGLSEIRPLSSKVGVLPRTHGSGLFTRGQTQVLSVCTLGALGDVQ